MEKDALSKGKTFRLTKGSKRELIRGRAFRVKFDNYEQE